MGVYKMLFSLRGLWILGIPFGAMMILAGLKALCTSRAEAYDRRSLETNVGAGFGLIIFGAMLLIVSWRICSRWFGYL